MKNQLSGVFKTAKAYAFSLGLRMGFKPAETLVSFIISFEILFGVQRLNWKMKKSPAYVLNNTYNEQILNKWTFPITGDKTDSIYLLNFVFIN